MYYRGYPRIMRTQCINWARITCGTRKNSHECVEAANKLGEKLRAELGTLQSIELLSFLKSSTSEGNADNETLEADDVFDDFHTGDGHPLRMPLALVAYLISKVNELELKTSNLLTSNQTQNSTTNDVFQGLRGKQLWDAWQVVVSTSVDDLGLDRDRDRLMMLLELHVRELVAAGKARALSPTSDTPEK